MRLVPCSFSFVPPCLALAMMVSTAEAQVPAISTRQYTGGSVTLVVTGSIQINDSVAINTAASFSDGEMTWLQYGASGSPTPNLLITFSNGEYGIGVGLGKKIATAEPQHCTGTTQVTATSVTGHYDCKGVTSYDGGTGSLGNVTIKVQFSAKT